MPGMLRTGVVLVLLGFAGPAASQAETPPCGKNHYILDEPCIPAWASANEGLADLDVQVVAVDPSDGKTLYAGGPSGVFKSTDAGASWSPTGLALAPQSVEVQAGSASRVSLTLASRVAHLAIDPATPSTVYASTVRDAACVFWQRRLFKSTDGGATWGDAAGPDINGCDNIHALELAPGAPSTLYVTNFDDSTGDTWSPLLRSSDEPGGWDYLGYPVINVLAVDPAGPLTLYGGTFDFAPYFTSLPNGVLKSVDGGVTWARTGLTGSGVSALALGRNGTLYAAAASGDIAMERAIFQGIFKSTDAGATWTESDHGFEGLVGSTSPVVAMIVDPDETGTLYVALLHGGVWRSGDAGASWQLFDDGLRGVSVRSLALAPGKPSTLYAGTSAGVFSLTVPATP